MNYCRCALLENNSVILFFFLAEMSSAARRIRLHLLFHIILSNSQTSA